MRFQSRDGSTYDDLLHMMEMNDFASFKKALEKDKRLLVIQNHDGEFCKRTLLECAFSAQKMDLVEILLRAGANPDVTDYFGCTLLMRAGEEARRCKNDEDKRFSIGMVESLVRAGASIDIKDSVGRTALIHSVKTPEIVDILIRAGANPNILGESLEATTALISAAQAGCRSSVELLIRAGASVDMRDRFGTTALFWAAIKGHTEVVEFLLRAYAEVDIMPPISGTPMCQAAVRGHINVVEILIQAGAQLDIVSEFRGHTPMCCAAEFGNINIVEILIQAGAKLDIKDKDGRTPIMLAASEGHVKVVDTLIRAGADVDSKDNTGYDALYLAQKYPAVVCVIRTDKEKRARVIRDEEERRACLLREEEERRARLLREEQQRKEKALRRHKKRLLVLRKCPQGWADLIIDYINRGEISFEKAIEVHPDDKAVEPSGTVSVMMLPLHYSIRHGAYDNVGLLIELGASVNERYDGLNSVDVAVICGEQMLAGDLVELGGEVTPKTVKLAIEHERTEFLEVIFDAHPDLVKAEFENCLMVCWAARLGKTDIAVDLLARGADKSSKFNCMNLKYLASNAGFQRTATELGCIISAGRALSRLSLSC